MFHAGKLRRLMGVAGVLVAGAALCSWTQNAEAAGYQVVYNFDGTNGAKPLGTLIPSGNILYGLTNAGGSGDDGVLFQFDTSTNGYTPLKAITLDTHSQGSPALVGDSLYFLTVDGGANSGGTVSRYNMTTNTITWVHSFANSPDGASPFGSLTGTGPVLYGTTKSGGGPVVGTSGQGTIFSLDTGTQAVNVVHRFQGFPVEGGMPLGDLLPSGSILYGTTLGGGTNGTRGTVFKFDLSTNAVTTLHTFNGGVADGLDPQGSVVQSGNFLYGMSSRGGTSDVGTLFEYDLTTGTFDLLHSFNGSDGSEPCGTPIVVGNVLYGMCKFGGVNACGTLYSYDLVSDTFTVLKIFAPAEGNNPFGSLTLSGNTLYGMTAFGGTNQSGVIFSYALPAGVPEPATLGLLGIGALAALRRTRR